MQYWQTLTLVTQWYNQLHRTILDVELGLVKYEMDRMKRQLDPALRDLTWAQDDLWNYIQSTRDLMKVPNFCYIFWGNLASTRKIYLYSHDLLCMLLVNHLVENCQLCQPCNNINYGNLLLFIYFH